MPNGRDSWHQTPEDERERQVGFRRYMTLIAVLLVALVGVVLWAYLQHA